MYCNNTLIARPPGLVPRHLDLLGQALERLTGETHQALARTIAHVAAGLICEAVATALAAPDPRPRPESWRRLERDRTILDPFDDPQSRYDDPYADSWRDDDFLPEHGYPHQLGQPTSVNWSAALALGLRVGAWWLGRNPGPLPVVSTLTLGTAATMAALASGPLAQVSVGIIEALLGLHYLTRATGGGVLLTRLQDD